MNVISQKHTNYRERYYAQFGKVGFHARISKYLIPVFVNLFESSTQLSSGDMFLITLHDQHIFGK